VSVLALLAIFLVSAAGEAPERYERPEVGLSVAVPQGWTVVNRPLTPCTNPVQALAIRGRGALVQLQESLDRAYVHRFPARPRRFALRGSPQWIPCCSPRDAKGWFLPVRDRGRAFYAYVYLGEPGTRRDVLAILDSLRVRAK
jgi:hypothetical protein